MDNMNEYISKKIILENVLDQMSKSTSMLAMSERIKNLEAADVIEAPRWIPVAERLPDENGKYLTVFTVNTIPPHPVIEVSCYAKDLYKIDKYDFQDKKKKSGFYQYDSEWGYFEMTDISHWMPLPQPPESEEQNG